jgi:hypothetical protein
MTDVVRWWKKKRNSVTQIAYCATGPNILRLMLQIDPILNRVCDQLLAHHYLVEITRAMPQLNESLILDNGALPNK